MKMKKTVNTILITKDFFEAAVFSLKKEKFYQQSFVSNILHSTDNETVAKTVESACRQNKIELKRDFSVVVSRALVTIKNLELPSTNLSEISQMVDFQLQDSLPYRLEDMIVQNMVYPSFMEGYSRVKAIILQKEIIDNIVEIFSLASIKVSKIDLSSNVLLSRFKMLYKKEPFYEKPVLLIDLESENIDFVFIKKGEILLSRGVVLYGDNFEENFAAEVRKSISFFAHKYPAENLSFIILWGRRSDLPVLKDLISDQAELEISVKEDENLLKSLAFSSDERDTKINLLPMWIQEKQSILLKRWNLIKMTLMSIIVILFTALGFLFDFKAKERELSNIDARIKKIEGDALKIQRKIDVVEGILAQQVETLYSLEVLAELYKVTQSGIFFNSFTLTPKNLAVIKGQSGGLDNIIGFVDNLEGAPLFENVELKYTVKRRLKTQEIIDFELAFFVKKQEF
ncbi:MAG: PilN domain-containing protein [Candidatus Omnitrophota bacterium]